MQIPRTRFNTFIFGSFCVLSIVAYFFIDFREPIDLAKAKLKEKQYDTALRLLYKKLNLTEEGFSIASLAIKGLETEINLEKDPNKRSKLIKHIEDFYKLRVVSKKEKGKEIFRVDDPYFHELKRHGHWFEKTLLAKIEMSVAYESPTGNTDGLLQILMEDPRPFSREFTHLLVKLFQKDLEPIGEIETEFLVDLIHYLASLDSGEFSNSLYYAKGNQITFRSGPGTENNAIGYLQDRDFLTCFATDSKEESIDGKKGNWKQCFSPKFFCSGWVFSGFIQATMHSEDRIDNLFSRFTNLQDETDIDFQAWQESRIPDSFYGDYLGSEKFVSHGEQGFTVYGGKNESPQLICKKLSSQKNYFEFTYEVIRSQEPFELFRLQFVSSGTSTPVYMIMVDENILRLNKSSFNMQESTIRETFSIRLQEKIAKPGAMPEFKASLFRRNNQILTSIPSLYVDPIHWNGRYSWEICIPQYKSKSSSKAVLFGFRLGKN